MRHCAACPEPRNTRKCRRQRAAWLGRWKLVCALPGGADCPTARSILLYYPFGGAGTIGLVAECPGRDSILIEIDPDRDNTTRRRITDVALFLTQPKAVA